MGMGMLYSLFLPKLVSYSTVQQPQKSSMFQAFSVGMELTTDVNILLLISLVSSN